MDDDQHNVIKFQRPVTGDGPEWSQHWAARAQSNPVWAAKQIGGLLERALLAESEVERLREGEAGDYWAVADERDAERRRAGEYALQRADALARAAALETALAGVSRRLHRCSSTMRTETDPNCDCAFCFSRAVAQPQ